MNQILSVEPPKPKKEKKQKNNMSYNYNSGGGKIEVEKIVRFFAIVLIVFGIIMIGSGSYSMYLGMQQTGNTEAKPTISVQEVSETQLRIEISHSSTLQRATYSWNSGDVVELDVSGKRSIEQTIEIPTGENTLNIYAIDQDGKETNYSRVYTRQGNITIDFAVDGSNLKVTASGKNQLSYLTYRWDDEEEQRIDINAMETEQSIEIPMGQHTITVSVVDINNTTETKEQEVKGVTKPTLEVTTDGDSHFIIKASDEEGLTRMEVTIDEDENKKYAFDLEQIYSQEERKEFEYNQFELHDGENKIEVTVYNESGVSETARVLVNK